MICTSLYVTFHAFILPSIVSLGLPSNITIYCKHVHGLFMRKIKNTKYQCKANLKDQFSLHVKWHVKWTRKWITDQTKAWFEGQTKYCFNKAMLLNTCWNHEAWYIQIDWRIEKTQHTLMNGGINVIRINCSFSFKHSWTFLKLPTYYFSWLLNRIRFV